MVDLRSRYFFIFWTLLALVVLWQYAPAQRKLDADASFMLYAGQQILRGHAPYVGVAIVKLPVSPLVAALGIASGRAFGLDDILAGRIAFWLCAGIAVGAAYLVGAALAHELTGFQNHALSLTNRSVPRERETNATASKTARLWAFLYGSASAAFFLSFQTLGIQVAEGPEAKLPMVCAGMLCLVLLAREKFFWAGVAGVIAFMAWQPGLVFVAAALGCAFVVTERKRAVPAALSGIALPLLLVGAYLVANGALGSMFRQAFGANANYFEEKKVAVGILSTVVANASKVWSVSLECSATEVPFVYLGYAGMLGGALFLAYRLWKTRDTKLFLAAFPLLLSGAGLFGFSLLDLQKCSDFVPLIPYLALGAAAFFIFLIYLVSVFLAHRAPLGFALGVFLILVILFFGARDAFTQPPQNGIAQQRALAQELAAQLAPQDRVQQFGDAFFLIDTQRENATRFVHLGEKQGLGILTAEGVSMEDLVAQLRAANPRVITLSRAKTKGWAKPLYDWIEMNYTLGASYNASEGGTLKETDIWWRK